MSKESKSEQYFRNKRTGNLAPGINAARSVSQFRKLQIGEQIERGEFIESALGNNEAVKTTSFGGCSFVKTAVVSGSGTSSSTGTSWRGGSDVARQGPEIYSPLWLTSNTHLPRDRGTMNAWCRAFFALHPIVNNAVSLHSTYPISKLNITCSNKKVEQFFKEMIEEMDLLNTCVAMAQEYFVIGECFPQLELDVDTLKWKRVIIQNPDYIFVRRSAIPGEPQISLRPDAELKRIITQNDPESKRIRSQLSEDIIKYVRTGRNIPLDNFYISHLARRISPYETRGTSIIAPSFKALMLWDKLRECKYAQADNLINPITLIKLGGAVDAGYMPTKADYDEWRSLMEEAQYDKDFKIITHGGVSIDRIGATAVIDINPDIAQLTKEIYIGLMVPQVVMEAGDVTYANGGLSLDVLRQRYLQFQNMMTTWIKTKIFAPIAQLNDFWDYEDDKKKLIIPNVEWNHMSLFDLTDYIQQLSGLVGEKKLVSVHTLYRSLGLDYENEKKQIKKESIDDAISSREREMLAKLSLVELKALGDGDDIPDLPDQPLPGESPDEIPAKPEAGGDMGGGIPSAPTPTP